MVTLHLCATGAPQCVAAPSLFAAGTAVRAAWDLLREVDVSANPAAAACSLRRAARRVQEELRTKFRRPFSELKHHEAPALYRTMNRLRIAHGAAHGAAIGQGLSALHRTPRTRWVTCLQSVDPVRPAQTPIPFAKKRSRSQHYY